MNKVFVSLLVLLFVLAGIPALLGQDKRIYNDGEIDYVPLEATFVLPDSGDLTVVDQTTAYWFYLGIGVGLTKLPVVTLPDNPTPLRKVMRTLLAPVGNRRPRWPSRTCKSSLYCRPLRAGTTRSRCEHCVRVARGCARSQTSRP